MKHSAYSIYLLPALLLLSLAAMGKSTLRELDINVVLAKNGDAHITEVRTMDIDDKGTECYIVVGNLNGSRIKNFGVTDDTGREYEYVKDWNTGSTRSEKKYKCGIVESNDGYQLCWGLGSSGARVYTTTYTITRLLRGYDDADGFNYMFVAKHINPEPEIARVTIEREDGQPFTEEETSIWAFRFDGDVNFSHGKIVAQTDEPLEGDQAMIVMVEVEKDIFSPAKTVDGSFDDVKQRAFDGSDYDDKKFDWSILLVFIFPILFVFLAIIYFFRRWRERRRIKRDMMWYRDIPLNGNLQRANEVLNCLHYFKTDYTHLLNAVVMRLISIGTIDVVTVDGRRGRRKQQLLINPLSAEGKRQQALVRQVHDILYEAAGDDHILQPKELKKWMRRHSNTLTSFVGQLKQSARLKDVIKDHEKVCQLYGLRQFLKDFSLANERHVIEVKLWNEYLVWATLFGIAKQVRSDMKKLNPDAFKLDHMIEVMEDEEVVPLISAALLSGTRSVDRSMRSRSDGGGGSASSGGGGGYSGGGSGGGIR